MSDAYEEYFSWKLYGKGMHDITQDLSELFSSDQRDFLIRNNGDQVKISTLIGRTVGIYFNARSRDVEWRQETSKLVEIYEEIRALQGDFEVVFVSWDKNEEEFNAYFATMPWLAIPFSEAEGIRRRMMDLFSVGAPVLVIIGSNGKLQTEKGIDLILFRYGADAYPFTLERFSFIKEQYEEAKTNQTLTSLLVSNSRDYLISNDGNQVPVSELVGKMVGLYFHYSDCSEYVEFTSILVSVYNQLKERGEKFEVVLISLEYKHDEFKQAFEAMPWLGLPYNDKTCGKLIYYFDHEDHVGLVIIGPDGKTLNANAAELIEEHGINAYPFTPERIEELEKAKQEPMSLESLLVLGGDDFVIGRGGSKVAVSELVGKNILLYFSSCRDCRYTLKLIKVYHEIKAKDDAFEVVFISRFSDPYCSKEQSEFDEFCSRMPWLALPFSDYVRNKRLYHWFKIGPWSTEAIFISSSGRTFRDDVLELLDAHRGDVYPFTPERFNFLKEQYEETKRNQSLARLLVSNSRDYLFSNDGNQVPVLELVGKTVGLFFDHWYRKDCIEFTSTLVYVYNKLKERGEKFEVVLISTNYTHEDFKEAFEALPWLALPYNDKSCGKLMDYFELKYRCPRLVILGPDGKTLIHNAVALIEEHGIDAFPFTHERLDELEKTKQEPLSLESLLVFGGSDFVLGKDGSKVAVHELVGRNILLYFANFKSCLYKHKLIEAYHEIKARDKAFEVIFISLKSDPCSVDEMPWLLLPFNDCVRKKRLCHWFKIGPFGSTGIFVSSSGRTVTDGIMKLISAHGGDAYPFTEERLKCLEEKVDQADQESGVTY